MTSLLGSFIAITLPYSRGSDRTGARQRVSIPWPPAPRAERASSAAQKTDLRAEVRDAGGVPGIAYGERDRVFQPIVPYPIRVVRCHRQGVLLRAQLAPES